jgi:hypothetical protein
MTKDELLKRLAEIMAKFENPRLNPRGDQERCHAEADGALLEFIGDPDVTIAYGEIPKWYA